MRPYRLYSVKGEEMREGKRRDEKDVFSVKGGSVKGGEKSSVK